MVETARKEQGHERICFVCQGTGSLPREQSSLRSILNTMQNTSQRSAPKTDGTPLEELSKLERNKANLEKQKKALLKTVERIQSHQDIIEKKKGDIQYKIIGR